MTNVIFQVVKEFKASVEGLDFEIKGRVLKRVSGDSGLTVDYKWEISHYYKPLDGATVYHPSQEHAETAERAEQLLLYYMTPFTNLNIETNPNY
jgi:hypothetical protein